MDYSALRDELGALGQEALSELNFDPEDKAKAETWLAGLGIAVAQGNRKVAQGYKDALSLLVAKYEVRVSVAAEKALLRTLTRIGSIAVAALT